MPLLLPVRDMVEPFMNGEAVRGGSGGASFHGSDGLKDVLVAVSGPLGRRGDGLNADALALSTAAVAVGEVLTEDDSLGLDSDRSMDGPG